jgi:molecular chaperone GrpE
MADQSAPEQDAAPREQSPEETAAGAPGDVAQWQQKVAEMEDRWRRTAADLDNFRKRVARDISHQREDERARVAAMWLPVLDNLERALEASSGSVEDADPIVQGLWVVRDQALDVLAALGYPRRDDVGRRFDPALHEAVGAVDDEEVPAGTVVRTVRPGYGGDDQILRPASVLVSARQ